VFALSDCVGAQLFWWRLSACKTRWFKPSTVLILAAAGLWIGHGDFYRLRRT